MAERIVSNAPVDIDVEEIKRRYDSESRFRSPSDWIGKNVHLNDGVGIGGVLER